MVKTGSGETTTIETGPGGGKGDTVEEEPNYIIIIVGGVLGLGAIGAAVGLTVAASGAASDREALNATLNDNSFLR